MKNIWQHVFLANVKVMELLTTDRPTIDLNKIFLYNVCLLIEANNLFNGILYF